jgi:hypothetical protein
MCTWYVVNCLEIGQSSRAKPLAPLSRFLAFSFEEQRASQSMQPQCIYACGNLTFPRFSSRSYHHHLNLIPVLSGISIFEGKCRGGHLKAKRKENIWSVDNDLAEKKALREKRRRNIARRRGRRNGSSSGQRGKMNSQVLVSGPMLMEVERILQTQVLSLYLLSKFVGFY